MGKAIILNFPKIPREEKNRLSELVTNKLDFMQDDINSWNGFIDVMKNENGNYSFIAKCDNEEIRSKMQEFLDTI